MAKEKRYYYTVGAYLYARNDREAMVKLAEITEEMRDKEDNQAQSLTLESAPYGS